MTVWIVVSILLVVLSPLAWLRPSRVQSGRMALRMEARRLGLAMQLAPQEWPHWLGQQPPNPAPSTTGPGVARNRRSGAIGRLRQASGSTSGEKSARMSPCSIISKNCRPTSTRSKPIGK